MKVAIYVRCSTADQSTAMQVMEIQEYAKVRSWLVTEIYEDMATGTNTKRPRFQQMMSDARVRRFDVILVWKLDRFARSLKDLITHLHELGDIGIAFVSIKDQLDLSSSMGVLMLHVLGAFAQFEASIIRERVRSGVRNKIAKTGKWGPPKKRDDQTIVALRAAGLSIRAIARRAGISASTVVRALKAVPGTPEDVPL